MKTTKKTAGKLPARMHAKVLSKKAKVNEKAKGKSN